MYSPELDTLDQLLSGPMPLKVVRQIFGSEEHFSRAILAMLMAGDLRLLDQQGADLADWLWRQTFADEPNIAERDRLMLALTHQGARRVG